MLRLWSQVQGRDMPTVRFQNEKSGFLTIIRQNKLSIQKLNSARGMPFLGRALYYIVVAVHNTFIVLDNISNKQFQR